MASHLSQHLSQSERRLLALVLSGTSSRKNLREQSQRTALYRSFSRHRRAELDQQIEQLYSSDPELQVIFYGSAEYPLQLSQSPDAPVVLFCKSRLSRADLIKSLQRPAVAIVGTRRITSYGKLVTTKIATELTQRAIPIVSGGMYGVDQAAHRAVLATISQEKEPVLAPGTAGTDQLAPALAVIGHGFHFLPARDRPFFSELLAKRGVILSEYPPDCPAQKWQFVERNRIVAGLAQVVVVTEAASKSGSLHTAQFALDAGRTVAAVPGPITSPYSEGTQWLINQGASFVASAQDIVLLDEKLQKSQFVESAGAGAAAAESATNESASAACKGLARQVLAELAVASQSAESLASELSVPLIELLQELSWLEIQGMIERSGEKWMLQ